MPRGQAVEWRGPRSCGKTALLRATLAHLHDAGEPVAVVDRGHTLFAPDWVGLHGTGESFWVVRPPEPTDAVWCADLLLRSGAFGAVALEIDTGGPELDAPMPSLSRSVIVRLQRLAEDAGAVFVVIGALPMAALRLRFSPGRMEPMRSFFGPVLPAIRPVWVGLGKGGSGEIPILCPSLPRRDLQPLVRDRKGPL